MGTINYAIATDLIMGEYDDDGPMKVVSYNNMFDGSLTYAVVMRREYINRYEESPACSNVKTLWLYDRDGYVKTVEEAKKLLNG